MVSGRNPSHFSITFFPSGTQDRSGEGGESRARGLGAFIGAQRRPLTRLPRSVHSPAKKWDHLFPSPLGFSGCGFFRAACCCNLAASSCFTSLIWSSSWSNASGASFSPAARGRNTFTSSKRTPAISASAGSCRSESLNRWPTLPAGSARGPLAQRPTVGLRRRFQLRVLFFADFESDGFRAHRRLYHVGALSLGTTAESSSRA